jgi:hypothetical protein
MPGRIQSRPRGFLAALGLKSSGQNPPSMLDEVRPGFDMGAHYLSGFEGGSVDSQPLAAVGDSVEIFVPQGKVWIPIALHYGPIKGTGSLAQPSRFMCSMQLGGVSVVLHSHTTTTSQNAAGDSALDGFVFPELIVLPPGTRFKAEAADLGALVATMTIQLAVGYYELDT